ncbi:hypothetical protein V6N13_029557 [Hibiscus sabdariffa]|uniref:Uncharacterized protein n=1 Tax=Hibiscus sabdariffa TaxID=183260 RepID=A0ABR2T9L4_9ROSI
MASATRQFDEFGGRPLDGFSMIPSLVPLERPSSPTLPEGQSVGKKARSDIDVVEHSDKVAMDVDHDSAVVGDRREPVVRNHPLVQEHGQRIAV